MSLGDWFIFGLNEHFSGMDIPIYLRASVCIFYNQFMKEIYK